MIEYSEVYIGYVTQFDYEKNFGFVETDDGTSYFFFFDRSKQAQLKKQGVIDKIHIFCSGDEVSFNLRPSLKDIKKVEACNIQFIKNDRRQKLIDEANQPGELTGYIKLVRNEKFFVKHYSTHVFVPLVISGWETDLEEVYYNRIDKLVTFKLTQTQKVDKIKAVLTDVKFMDEYYKLLSALTDSTILLASVIRKNSKGLFVTLFNGKIEGFISLSEKSGDIGPSKIEKLKKGDVINVKIKHILNNKRVSLFLINN